MDLSKTVQHDTAATDPLNSLLFRLVDLALRTHETASSTHGHLGQRYIPLLRSLVGIVQVGKQIQQDNVASLSATADSTLPDLSGLLGDDLLAIWQQSGLDLFTLPNFYDNR